MTLTSPFFLVNQKHTEISLIPEQKTYEPIRLSESKSYSTDREVWFQNERLLWTIIFSESQILMNQLSLLLHIYFGIEIIPAFGNRNAFMFSTF